MVRARARPARSDVWRTPFRTRTSGTSRIERPGAQWATRSRPPSTTGGGGSCARRDHGCASRGGSRHRLWYPRSDALDSCCSGGCRRSACRYRACSPEGHESGHSTERNSGEDSKDLSGDAQFLESGVQIASQKCPPSCLRSLRELRRRKRPAFDGSRSGGRFGETAFACQSVRGPVAGEGSNCCRGSAFALRATARHLAVAAVRSRGRGGGWLGGRDLNPDNVVQRQKGRKRR
jgi:hypothetical protein